MKKISFLTFLPLFVLSLVSCYLWSCKKNANPNSATPGGTGASSDTFPINLSYNAEDANVKNFELIVTNKAGDTVLLDTVAAVNTQISALLKTNDRSFNVTAIHYDSVAKQYTANTYTNVNPSAWVTITNGLPQYPQVSPVPAYTPAYLYYYNAPTATEFPYFANAIFSELNNNTESGNSGSFHYDRCSGNYDYLLFPNAKRYTFFLPSTNDTSNVDLSHMDTAIAYNFIAPPSYSLFSSALSGYMDTTNFLRTILLYTTAVPLLSQRPYDIEYPRKLVQKYEFEISWNNTTGDAFAYYNFGYSVPAANAIPFLTASNYSILSNQASDFEIQFINTHPAWYETGWTTPSGNIRWNVFSSPDSTTQHPISIFLAQNSKMLSALSISGIRARYLLFEDARQANGLPTGYADHFNYLFNPAQFNKKLIVTSSIYQKTLF